MTVILLITFVLQGESQSYGLRFSSHEVVQDKRTSLDLSPGKTLCLSDNFDLSFDIAFFPNLQVYFGYIMRIITEDKQSIDLVYDERVGKHFHLVVAGKLSHISFDIPRDKLFNQWNKIRIRFDFRQNRLLLYSGNQVFVEDNIGLKKDACYKILVGINSYKQFQTTDIPPMKIRDICILQNNVLKYNWPLNEDHGNIAHEVIAQNDAVVNNPMWMTALHHEWRMIQAITVKGAASVAFNADSSSVYVVSDDSLYTYSINRSNWTNKSYKEGNIVLNAGNQAAYNPFDHHLYMVYPDLHLVSAFNFKNETWNQQLIGGELTQYWQFNKLFSKPDTSLYILGGYGQLVYKNQVQQYGFKSGTWRNVAVKGDFFMPRYLAALGSTAKGDTAYIIGGYGNASGKQILGPKNMYDVLRFTVRDKTFKKLFDLNIADRDLAFANSLVIDSRANTYYGLVFQDHKYNSGLQLISGSLLKPAFKLEGSIIPYSFHDTHSFADLYYSKKNKKFVAVTLLRLDNGQTKVNIYTLLCPPYTPAVASGAIAASHRSWLYALLSILVVSGFVVFLLKKKKASTTTEPAAETEDTQPGSAVTASAVAAQTTEMKRPELPVYEEPQPPKNSIFLFGDIQVFDAEGIDITKYFTPLIKELFLLILLNSIKWGRGLSSEKLNEILWFDKDAKSARNNRSVNITKLKSLLDRLEYCQLSKDTGYWKIEIDYKHIYVDYHTYLAIIKDKKQLDINRIKQLTDIVRRGNFLSNIEYEWLDPFKSEISNEVIDNLLHFIRSGHHGQDYELLIEIVNFIFYFDPVNEEAMVIKCKALSALGKHSLARNTFENFIKEYRGLYGEDFKKDFHAVTE